MKWILFLGLFSTVTLSAQSEILENPDVVWAALITQDWNMDVSLLDEWDSGLITVKQCPVQQSGLNYSSPLLADLIYDAFASARLPVFKDPECTIPEDFFLDYRTDTIVHFDPVTFEEEVSAVYEEPFPERDMNFWRVRQILYYNKKKATWGTEILSIAPVLHNKRFKENELPEFIPLFWFKPINQIRHLQNKDITWAKKTFGGKTEETTIIWTQDSLLKVESGFEHPYLHFIEVFGTRRKGHYYDSRMEHKLSLTDRKNMLVERDSIVIFDPETYETSIIAMPPKARSENITQIRLVQNWAWDAKKIRLYTWLEAVAPMYERDPNAIKKGRGFPLFYQKIQR